MDKEITAAIEQLAEEQRKLALATGKLIMDGVGEKGKGIDLNEYRLVEGGPKGLAMNTP